MNPKFRPVFRWTALGTTAAVGLTYLALGGHQLYHAHQSSTWPSVNGLIITTEVKNADQQVQSIYEYEVATKTYTGDQLTFGETSLPSLEAARIRAEKFPAGTQVKVFHHPTKHGHSTLETGARPQLYRMPLIGAALLMIGLPLSWVALRAAERRH